MAAIDSQEGLARVDVQRRAVHGGQGQRRGRVALGPADLLPRAVGQVEAGPAGKVILAGVAVVLDAAGGIEHEHIFEGHARAVVGVGRGGAVGVVLLIQAGFGVVEQLLGGVDRESDRDFGGVEGLGRFALRKVEQGHIGPGRVGLVHRKPGVDEVAACIPAVFLAVAAGVAVGVKLEGRRAGVQAVDILVREQVEQVGGVAVFADVHRHRVERQRELQPQITRSADRADLAQAVRFGKHGHHRRVVAFGHALDHKVGGGQAPVGGRALAAAQRNGHGAAVGVIFAGLFAGQRVGGDSRGRGGFRRGRRGGGGGRRRRRRGRGARAGQAAARQQRRRQQRRGKADA